MSLRNACPEPWDTWRRAMIPELEKFHWFFDLDSSKCFEKKSVPGWNSIPHTDGTKPTQMLRILVKAEVQTLPSPVGRTPVLDAAMLAEYTEDHNLDNAAVLDQRAPSLRITEAQLEELNRIPGRRVPANILALREEEEEEEE
ncbi:hypothetical protein C8R45DRAFT_1112049 [Mycena sanguinolenta]|nr:hypothetical protein C8R45DRAFT_1112049 [Mycena sanguinolenta]